MSGNRLQGDVVVQGSRQPINLTRESLFSYAFQRNDTHCTPFRKRIGMKKIVLSAEGLSLEDLVAVARKGAGVALSEKSKKAIRKSRNLVEQWIRQGKIVYGMTT
ncbi:MAG: hypothetical protein EHM26_04900, partial [Desulfobacteraceae bacterium]